MKAWHLAAAVIGVGIIMVLVRNMQTAKAASTGATSNDVILGLSKFGSGLLDLGGKIFAPSKQAPGTPTYSDIGNESVNDYARRQDAGYGDT